MEETYFLPHKVYWKPNTVEMNNFNAQRHEGNRLQGLAGGGEEGEAEKATWRRCHQSRVLKTGWD